MCVTAHTSSLFFKKIKITHLKNNNKQVNRMNVTGVGGGGGREGEITEINMRCYNR